LNGSPLSYSIIYVHLPFQHIAGAGLLGRGELYVVGGGMYSSLLVKLDAAGGCWHSCEGPRTPRLHAAVAGASGDYC
jgi:hypothetical protein